MRQLSENLRVATLKGERFDGGEEPAAKCDTRLNSLWSVCNALGMSIDDLFKKVIEQLPENFTLVDM